MKDAISVIERPKKETEMKMKNALTPRRKLRLQEAYDEYVNTRIPKLETTMIASAGFCLATLSSANMPHWVNLSIMGLVAVFLLYTIYDEQNNSTANLYKLISSLEQEYKRKENTDDIAREIKSYNIWKSWGGKAFKSTLLLTVSSLFVLYASVEHLFRLYAG